MATAALIAEPPRTRRPSRGSGRLPRPAASPQTAIRGPRVDPVDRARIRACAVTASAPAIAGNEEWRLTNRGIAVIMVIGLIIATAAMIAIGSTFLRVTGDDYRPAVTTSVD